VRQEGEYGSIVAAAIYYGDFIFSVPAPGRHNHVINLMYEMGFQTPIGGEQGFLTSTGWFVRRKPAVWIAQQAGQIDEPKWGDQLYSEDLW
jgi:hypothetical protein